MRWWERRLGYRRHRLVRGYDGHLHLRSRPPFLTREGRIAVVVLVLFAAWLGAVIVRAWIG